MAASGSGHGSGNGTGNGNGTSAGTSTSGTSTSGTSTGGAAGSAAAAAGVGASVGAANGTSSGNGNASANSSSSNGTSTGTSQGSVGSVGNTASNAVSSGLSAGDSRGYSNSMSGYGNTGFATQTAAAAHSPSSTATTTTSGTPTQSMKSYNIKGVDENGLTMKGVPGDRNGDGKISFGEAIANNFSNLGQRANTFFGGADANGLTRAGRAADRNGDGRISAGERIGNMFNNMGTSINQAFGGVNYQGYNKSGEQVVAPGEHVTFAQRMTNIGHNLASKNGATWNDENNNGIMDKNEVTTALAGRLATGIMGMTPVLGTAMSNFVAGAMGGKSKGVAGQLGTSLSQYAAAHPSTNSNVNATYTGSTGGPSTLAAAIEKLPDAPTSNSANEIRNFMKKAKKIDISAVPVTSTYIKRGEEKSPAVTVSDEDIKSFALRFYHSK